MRFLANYFITDIFGLITSLLRFFGYFWPKNHINEINNPQNALAKYFWNVFKNCSNEIRIMRGPPVPGRSRAVQEGSPGGQSGKKVRKEGSLVKPGDPGSPGGQEK